VSLIRERVYLLILKTFFAESCPKNLTQQYCDDSLPNWGYLGPKNDYTLKSETLKQDEVKYYRFHIDDPCVGFQIRLYYEYGTVEVYVSTISSNILLPSFESQTWSISGVFPGHTQLTICPSNALYKPGTYVVATVCRKPEAKYDIEIHRSEVVTERPASVGGGVVKGVNGLGRGPSVGLCPNSSTIVCLNDTQPYTFTTKFVELPQFRFDVTGKKGTCTRPITGMII